MSKLKVHIWPTQYEIEPHNGIGRVIHAQYKHLPEFDIELTPPESADVIACHTQQYGLPRVDALHLHGMYWTGEPESGEYSSWHHRANQEIASAARRARVVTVPSDWVAIPFRRDMRINPLILGHGIETEEWNPGKPGMYTLWNKNRPGDVCSPEPALRLAQRGIEVISTFAPSGATIPANMVLTGKMDADAMKELIRNAHIYLATVKETFGIGTLEAMACGVPVLGYAHGGTLSLVEHKKTGYLVRPGDIDGLQEGWEWLTQNRDEVGARAREVALQYSWRNAIQKYAELYMSLAGALAHGVSIVIPCYNYGKYLPEAVKSAMEQTQTCEVIVVNDGSTDDSLDIARRLQKVYPRLKVLNQNNAGVAAARNNGIRAASGTHIVCLDPDDRLDNRYVETLFKEMVKDRGLGVAYTGLALLGPDGKLTPNGWPPEFSWEYMTKPTNTPASCIPCAAMFRKDMWERCGGYRQTYAPAEDTEFWVRGLSVGFSAKRVTDDGLFHYRPHEGSASRTLKYKRIDDFHPWMRDKQYPLAAPAKTVPLVRSYTPVISVIIPVADHHIKFLPTALDSLLGQTFRDWEVIVVTSGIPSTDDVLKPYPFVRMITSGPFADVADNRNIGLDNARAPLTAFLDADDYLHPTALQKMLELYSTSGGRYVYTDWAAIREGKVEPHECPNYDPKAMLEFPQHAVTVLIDTEKARNIKFDDTLEVLEDWDFFRKCAIRGYHGVRLPEFSLYVRIGTGLRTTKAMSNRAAYVQKIRENPRQGEFTMAGCCGGGADTLLAAKAALAGLYREEPEPAGEGPVIQTPKKVRMEYIGNRTGAISYGGAGTIPSGSNYRGGNNMFDKYVDALPEDVAWLKGTGDWREVKMPPAEPEQAPVEELIVPKLEPETLVVPIEPDVAPVEIHPIVIDENSLTVLEEPKAVEQTPVKTKKAKK